MPQARSSRGIPLSFCTPSPAHSPPPLLQLPPPRPQDAHEFLNYLLNVSSELLEGQAKERGDPKPSSTWVTDIFQVGAYGAGPGHGTGRHC
jgi:hypothetical protein